MKRFLFFFVTYLFAACSSPNKIPDDIMGIDKMKLIVWDLTQAGKLAQVEYERSHLDTYTKGRSTKKDTASRKNISNRKKKSGDSITVKKDTSVLKNDSLSYKYFATRAFQQVFDIYHITKEEFYKSYRYYEEHPDKNNILMDSLVAYGARQRQNLYNKTK